ncbi:hypothetical protein B0H14DRAFT_3447663 [Mycena olivaceomarginata]|nr:hypothetical protein B0H14DRAFT_3447663 [Mycena olivaceomarginata]
MPGLHLRSAPRALHTPNRGDVGGGRQDAHGATLLSSPFLPPPWPPPPLAYIESKLTFQAQPRHFSSPPSPPGAPHSSAELTGPPLPLVCASSEAPDAPSAVGAGEGVTIGVWLGSCSSRESSYPPSPCHPLPRSLKLPPLHSLVFFSSLPFSPVPTFTALLSSPYCLPSPRPPCSLFHPAFAFHIVLPTILSFHFILFSLLRSSSLRLRFAFIRLPSLSSSPNLIFRPSHRIPSLPPPSSPSLHLCFVVSASTSSSSSSARSTIVWHPEVFGTDARLHFTLAGAVE